MPHTTKIRFKNIYFKNISDSSPNQFVKFFDLIGEVDFEEHSDNSKGPNSLVYIALTVAGTWAAERFILDPLADRALEWWQTITSLGRNSYKIEVIFEDDDMTFETIKFTNPLILNKLWRTFKSVSDIIASHPLDLEISRILIVPYKSDIPLVIASTWNRPKYIIDPVAKTITPIIEQNHPAPHDSPARQLAVLQDLASQLDDLRRYSNSDPLEITELENKLTEKILKWTTP